MMKPITGQYEYVHHSGVGLDYFTSRINRLILQPNGRFVLAIQEHSRVSNAAQSLMNGQQVSATAPEVKREGSYHHQNTTLWLNFDDGVQEQGQLSPNGDSVQIGKNLFSKVSDSTLLPPTHRMKQDMDDIAKGMKFASTLGSFAVKAAKTINETIQATKEPGIGPQPTQNTTQPAQPSQPPPYQPRQNIAPQAPPPPHPSYQSGGETSGLIPPVQPIQPSVAGQPAAIFCDQCGTRIRPGKRFCNNCGARLT